jgi:plastocyanin
VRYGYAKGVPVLTAIALLGGELTWAGSVTGHVHVRNTITNLSTFVVSVDDIEGTFPAPTKPAVMDQKHLEFVPHVLPVLVGSTVEFPNSDPLMHNVFSISPAKRFNLGLYPHGTVRRMLFDKPGVVAVLCNVHLEMSGFIVVLRNPYFARTEADGSYSILGVPAGKHRLRCWHEKFTAQEKIIQVPTDGSVNIDFAME